MKVKVKKLTPSAKLPTYATPGSACFDLHSVNVARDLKTYGTGLVFEVPEGHVMLIFSRSGHGYKHGVRLSNCVGVIDSDYRGEVTVKLHQDRDDVDPYYPIYDERIAQAMIIPVEQVQFELSDELSETVRGTGGFGSTGK